MNNRRQTIWLVSMLSLMVILSAYYLFTEDVNPPGQPVNQEAQTDTEATGDASGVQITQIETAPGAGETATDGATTDGATTEDEDTIAGTDDEGAAATTEPTGSGTMTDEEVIQGMTSLTGREYFDDAQLRRMEYYSKEEERLNAIIADNKNNTADEASSAIEELSRLDAVEQKITSLEEKLTTDYENAVVEEENSNFKVVVQADKLDKAQAVAILDLAAKELDVTPNQLTVQYIPNP